MVFHLVYVFRFHMLTHNAISKKKSTNFLTQSSMHDYQINSPYFLLREKKHEGSAISLYKLDN